MCATRREICYVKPDVSSSRAEQHVGTRRSEESQCGNARSIEGYSDTWAEDGGECCQLYGHRSATSINVLLNNADKVNLGVIHRTIKDIFDCGITLSAHQVGFITRMTLECGEDRVLVLRTIFLALLACGEPLTESAIKSIGDAILTSTISTNSTEQLALVDLYYCTLSQHPYIMHQLPYAQRSYMEFLNEVRQYIRLKVPCDADSVETEAVRLTLNALNVGHYAAIAGHIYLPVVLSGTHMVIEVSTDRYDYRKAYTSSVVICDAYRWKELIPPNSAYACLVSLSRCVFAEWDTDFVEDSKSIPSIEIKLSPPENPLPQVSYEIDKLEARRVQMEEGMMAKLEDKFNETLVDSRDKIKQIVNQQLDIFNDERLKTIVRTVDTKKESHLKSQTLPKAPSFIEIGENIVPSSVRVMMGEVDIPDPAIKTKMEQIEQSRSYEEIQVFNQQSDEMEQLTNVTLIELERALKLQLKPYLTQIELYQAQTHTTSAPRAQLQPKQAPAFIQTYAYPLPNTKQLNVKIGQSEEPYPTVEDYVMNMEKKRDAAERNERNTVLTMYLKLVKAQHEMIRDELRIATSNIISQYGGIIDATTTQEIRKRHHK
ncbi:blood stage antigen 41-3, putative [Babesia ovata]|uniref:Blood stage antigen 41-3, putative n=1 Tax=Babesia ovata TaxID=189622 RepID=A0A2H6K9B3_9APIC|nr:blood stage antigen 41-3, putative [Babesia ovata]GBE59586.1 blood stage antigen 41-3, putative [Babesia ovata]